MRRKKWGDKKKIMEWRVWRKEAVIFLQSCILLELEFDNFLLLL